jgi:gluconate 2-dehydrogenase subunit 3-like protein
MKRVSRRGVIKTIGAAAAAPIVRLDRIVRLDQSFPLKAEATGEGSRGFRLQADDPAILAAIAEVVLPADADRKAAVDAFTTWIANYTEGADTDHGYGNTRVRSTGPSPARNYSVQIAALDAAAKAKGAAGFAAASLDQRRLIVEAAIADAKIDRLSARPTGAHIATDLMGHYFNSPTAQDLCYRAAIGRDACRGLAGSEKKPTDLSPKQELPPESGSYRLELSAR